MRHCCLSLPSCIAEGSRQHGEVLSLKRTYQRYVSSSGIPENASRKDPFRSFPAFVQLEPCFIRQCAACGICLRPGPAFCDLWHSWPFPALPLVAMNASRSRCACFTITADRQCGFNVLVHELRSYRRSTRRNDPRHMHLVEKAELRRLSQRRRKMPLRAASQDLKLQPFRTKTIQS